MGEGEKKTFTLCDLSDQRTSLGLHWAQSGGDNRRCRYWSDSSNSLTRSYGDHFGWGGSRHGPLLRVDHLCAACICGLDRQQTEAQ